MKEPQKEEKSFAEWLPEAVEESKDILQELRLLNIYKSLGVDNLKDAQSKIEQLVAEKQGLISLDDYDNFNIWAKKNKWDYSLLDFNWYVDGRNRHTTAQLFQIYKQQTK